MALIDLKGIVKSYRLGQTEVPALRGVDLAVEAGEFTVVMGSSGSGKTTLLNIIGLLDRADAGSFKLDGEELAGRPQRHGAPPRASTSSRCSTCGRTSSSPASCGRKTGPPCASAWSCSRRRWG